MYIAPILWYVVLSRGERGQGGAVVSTIMVWDMAIILVPCEAEMVCSK